MSTANRKWLPVVTLVLAFAIPGISAQRASLETLAEVRQLVTFRFSSRGIFGPPTIAPIVELYRQTPAVRRVRGYREAESPEPFDLILMTSYRGLEGFDRARQDLSGQRTRSGMTLAGAYQRIEQTTEWHRDHFIEMIGDLDHQTTTPPEFFVFEWIRLVPAARRAYELLLDTTVLPWEKNQTFLQSTETGRVFIGEGWDYLRILGFTSMAGYQDYLGAWRHHPEADALALHVTDKKVFVVREDEGLRVR